MERKKKREKKQNYFIHTYKKKKERQNVCAAMDLFPLYLLSPSGMLRKEMLLLCCVLLFLHSDMIVAHTSLWCLRGKLSWGKFFLEQRLFRRHSSHHFRLITAITIWNQFPFFFRDSALNLFAVPVYITLFSLRESYSRNEKIYTYTCKCLLHATIKNRIVQDRFPFEKIQ